MSSKRRFSTKTEELDYLEGKKSELLLHIKHVRVEAKREIAGWEAEAKALIGERVLAAVGGKWNEIDYQRLVNEIEKGDFASCEAQRMNPYFAIKRAREAMAEGSARGSSEPDRAA